MLRVLYVDDSRFAQKSLRLLMTKAFEDTTLKLLSDTQFKNIEKEIDLSCYDIILIDLLMPVMSGHEIIKYVRKNDANIFISVLSSNVQKSEKELAYEAGANHFIEKPCTLEKITEMRGEYNEYNKEKL